MAKSDTQSVIGSWRQRLARSLHLSRSKAHARFVQLASLGHDGRVHNRTLVFRGFVDNTDQLIMITDTRSDKYMGLIQHPQVEICWYFEKSREQYRINGDVLVITNASSQADLREQVWHSLSLSAKEQFYWYLDKAVVAEIVEQGSIPDTFSVILLQPVSVDYLYLGDEHTRTISQLVHNKWQEKPINP